MNFWRYLWTKFYFPWIIRGKSKLSTNYTAERHAFLRYNSQKVKTFSKLFCIKAGPWKVFDILQIILQKGMPFRRKKFMESQNFPWIILQKGSRLFLRIIHEKSKLSANRPLESFSLPPKVKISLLKGLSLLLKLILVKNMQPCVTSSNLDLEKNWKTRENWEQ